MTVLLQWLGVLSCFVIAGVVFLAILGTLISAVIRGIHWRQEFLPLVVVSVYTALGIAQLVWYGWVS
jgi:hypothetical protein